MTAETLAIVAVVLSLPGVVWSWRQLWRMYR